MTAQILEPTAPSLALVARHLQGGDVVAIPTETVYGLAANALDAAAVVKVFEVKERPAFDPLIVHLHRSAKSLDVLRGLDLIDWSRLDPAATRTAEQLVTAFWPGPLTLVLPKTARVPDLVTSGLDSVALRMPDHPVAQAVLEASGRPLAAPSANRFGRISPTTAEAVHAELGERIAYILDGGPCERGIESTVVQVGAEGECVLLRPGALEREAIEAELGRALAKADPHRPDKASPGMLQSHYAPRRPMLLLPRRVAELTVDDWHEVARLAPHSLARIGLLLASGDEQEGAACLAELTHLGVTARSLSRAGIATEAARRLFKAMRELDDLAPDLIVAEPPPSTEGLWYGISDRIGRACLQ